MMLLIKFEPLCQESWRGDLVSNFLVFLRVPYGRSNILFIQKSSEFVQCDAFYMSKSGFVKLF
jgi:hypothetical protein